MGNTFWEVNVGHLLTVGSLLIAFWGAHKANVKRIEQAAERFSKVETKVEIMYDWFLAFGPNRMRDGD